MTLKELERFKKRAKAAFVAWETADVIAWEVDDVSSWMTANKAVAVRDRTASDYETAIRIYNEESGT